MPRAAKQKPARVLFFMHRAKNPAESGDKALDFTGFSGVACRTHCLSPFIERFRVPCWGVAKR